MQPTDSMRLPLPLPFYLAFGELGHLTLPGMAGQRKVGGFSAPHRPQTKKVGRFSSFVTLGGSCC